MLRTVISKIIGLFRRKKATSSMKNEAAIMSKHYHPNKPWG